MVDESKSARYKLSDYTPAQSSLHASLITMHISTKTFPVVDFYESLTFDCTVPYRNIVDF